MWLVGQTLVAAFCTGGFRIGVAHGGVSPAAGCSAASDAPSAASDVPSLSIVPTSQALATVPPVAATDPLLEPAALWAMIEPHSDHLSDEGRANLRASVDVLVSKAATASRAREAGLAEPLPWCLESAKPALASLEPRFDALSSSTALAVCDPAESAQTELDQTSTLLAVLEGLSSAKMLLEKRCDAPTAAAAMLGVAALTETAPTWPAALPEVYFGAVVDGLLVEARRLERLPRAARDLDDANAEALRHAILSSTTDPRALLVLLAGQSQQLRRSAAMPSAAQQSVALAAMQLYAPLAHSVGLARTFPDLERLAYASLFPASLARLRQWYELVWPDAADLLPLLQRRLLEELQTAPSLAGLLACVDVSGRVKKVESTFRKLIRDGAEADIERVRDVIALRVVLTPAEDAPAQLGAVVGRPQPSEAEAEAVLVHAAYKYVRRLWQEVPGRFKDFVRSPKPNGYQSIHTNVLLQDGRLVEVQLRTAAMHERAERGSAAHHLYKGGVTGTKQLELGHAATRAVAALLPAGGAAPARAEQAGGIVPSVVDAEEMVDVDV